MAARYHIQDRGYETPCWVWQGSRTRKGYGRILRARRVQLAHRYIYEETHGAIPDGLELDHLCSVKACVNPDHLEAVTHAENLQRAGKLTASAVREIRNLILGGWRHRDIADAYGVTRSMVSHIGRNEAWRNV